MRKITKLQKKNKKAISIMVGYILLISFAIIMSAIIYTWLKSYAPTDNLTCPDEVSLFIKSIDCDALNDLNLTLKNNGKFSIGGYFIRGTVDPDQEIATLDFSGRLNGSAYSGGLKLNPGVKFLGDDNPMDPGEEINNKFSLIPPYTDVQRIEIIPLRYQEDKNKKRLVVCGNSKITQEITCD